MISASFYNPYEDKNLVKFLTTYLNKNPCCDKKICRHPKKQSNSFLFDSKRKSIQYLKEQFYARLNNNLKKYWVVEEKFWVLLVEKNKPTPAVWHNHHQEKYKNMLQISGITYITSTNLDVTDSVNVFMARFNSGSGGFILFQNGGNIASGTITSSSTYSMQSGMMALGRWSLGNINSGAVADSAFDGQFYEIIVYNRAISDAELVTANTALLAKYN